MASTYSTRIRLEKQGAGENANTWGDRLNQNVVSLVDAAIAGVVDVDVDAQTSIALTENNGSSDQGRNAGLNFTGSLTAPCTVTYEADSKVYFVNNSTTGDQAVVMKNNTHTVSVRAGEAALVASNSTAMYKLGPEFQSGTKMLFQQSTAPIGWTKDTTHNDKALRVVNGTVGSGGTIAFSTFFDAYTPAGTLGGNTGNVNLTTAQIPGHTHTFAGYGVLARTGTSGDGTFEHDIVYDNPPGQDTHEITATGAQSGKTDGETGSAHAHSLSSGTFTGTEESFDVSYVDIIVATKD